MKNLFSRVVLGAGIVAAMILSMSTYTFAIIGDAGKPLAEIEAILQRVEMDKIMQPNDEPLDKFFDAFVEAVKRERKAVGTDKNKLTEFRNALKLFEGRLKNIENRMKNIEGKIKTGEIKLSKPLLQTMNQTEIGEFKKILTPNALNQYEKLHPEFFKPAGTPDKSPPRPRSMNENIPNDGNICVAQDFLNFLSDILVPPAYADLWTCYDRCDRELHRCKSDCCRCRWYKPHCCVCRAGCYVLWGACNLSCEAYR